MYPDSLKNLIESFKSLPGIGGKTAERFAFSLISFDKDALSNFSTSILDVRDKLSTCCLCHNICEGNICNICESDKRNKDTLFIVEKPKDVFLFEKLSVYNGLYYVLGGVISPLDGIGPDELKINFLLNRIKNENIKEVILALKPSLEGETTMQYITKILSGYNVNVSKLATGVPMGTDMEYIDSLTLEMALEDRKSVN